MNSPDRAVVQRLVDSSSLGEVRELVPVSGGSNNRVYRVECTNGRALLKAYFHSLADRRDRLGAEFAFARFAREAGVRCVPAPLACDAEANLGLFEYVDGMRPEAATESLVRQASRFIRAVNAARAHPAAAGLPRASEACFSLEEQLGVVGGRVNRLGDLTPDGDLDREALLFVRRGLQPTWGSVRDRARALGRERGFSFGTQLGRRSWCLSPSDFGFHNALVAPDGSATFVDFEYAGWDDPAKLICDFFCQPAVPVPALYFESFASEVAECFPDPGSIVERARLLLPVFRIKWVCIRLNEFLPDGSTRRSFSGAADQSGRKLRQLESARSALAAEFASARISA